MRRLAATVLGLMLAGCGEPELSSTGPSDEPPPVSEPPAAIEACRADAESFVLRTMPLVHGRRPLGSSEVRMLADVIDDLDAHGRDGRREVTRGMADGETYRRRWGSELMDLLRTRRWGPRTLIGCYGNRGPAAETAALAEFVRERPITESFPDGPWTMRDLIESTLRADDLRPLLRADLVVRMSAPIDDANTSPEDLEQARRTNFGRAFEAVYLGRRFECLGCHRDDASVTDHPDPQLDRFWPVAQGLEQAVYPSDEDTLHAVFRWEGVADGELAPWGSEGCGFIQVSRDRDPYPSVAAVGGALPAGAHVLDLQQRLDEGLAQLEEHGWSDRPSSGAEALAQLVVLHLVDGLWASATGQRLTLDHGTPRNEAQAKRLRTLAVELVRSGYSLRALLVEIAADPHVDQAVPSECELEGPEPLPAIFEPFAAADPEIGPGANGVGHRVHRRDPFALLDEAHRLLGRTAPGQVMGQDGFDPERVGSLGAHLRESQPGHGGVDLLGVLAWEQALGAMPEAPAADRDAMEPTITLDDLVAASREEPSMTVGDLMIAIKDRVLAEPHIDAPERALVEALIELSWDAPAREVPWPRLHEAAERHAQLLMATPQFLLTGLERAPKGDAPRLVLPLARPASLCARWGPRLLSGEPWTCTDRGIVLR